MNPASQTQPETIVSVPIARWATVAAPSCLRTLLGSCVGVAVYDLTARVGGLAHVLLPDSRGQTDQPGKYADTAILALVAEIEAKLKGKPRSRLVAKIAGGANMFATTSAMSIGEQNVLATESILSRMDIKILARHTGGETGRRMTLDPKTGVVEIRIPGGGDVTL